MRSLVSAYVAFPLAERLQGRVIEAKVAGLRAHYALPHPHRRTEAVRRLADIVAFAGAQVPYYRDLFARIRFEPENLRRDPAFLNDLPFLTKDIVRAEGERLLARPLAGLRHHRMKTGASTGPSAFFYYDQDAADWSSAVTTYARERIGASRRHVQMHLAAHYVDRPETGLHRERFKEIAMNRINVHFDRVDDAGLARIWDAVRRRTPYLLHAHPSTIFLLARFVAQSRGSEARPPSFQVFESSGEVLEDGHRQRIAETLGCRIVDRYGLAEFGIVAYELEGPAAGLQVLESEGWPENRPSTDDDTPELVITGFRNRLMPLIRYCTGDLAQVTETDGIWRLGRVVGRVHDVVTVNSTRYVTHHIQDVLDHRIGNIDEFQIDVTTSPPTLRVVPAAGIDREALAQKINAYWPNGFSLAFVGADELIRVGHRAKFRHVVFGSSLRRTPRPAMKVLFATYPTAFHVPGGGEVQLLAYQRHLAKHGVEVILHDPWKPRFRECDLVHYFSCIGGSSQFCGFVRQLGLPLVVSSSLWLSADRLADYPVTEIKTQLSLANAVVTNSNAECDRLSQLLSLPREKFCVVRNAVEDWFLEPADPAPFRTHLSTQDPFVLNVGNIEPRKNQVLLAKVMAAFPDHKLVLIGSVRHPAYWAEVTAAAGPNLIHVGALPHASALLRSAYAGCALFALPSLLETPGLAALEAAAQGAPLLLTNEGCCEEYFGARATYVDPRAPEDVQAAMAKLLGAQIPRIAAPVPSWSEVTGDLVAVYEKVLALSSHR